MLGVRVLSKTLHAMLETAGSMVLFAVILVAGPATVVAQATTRAPRDVQTIEDRTQGMRKLDGFFPLYWDDAAGQLFMEIPRMGEEVLHVAGLAAGLGSNDIGLDRGMLQGSRIVKFERVGPKVFMVQPNYDFRASSTNAAEIRSVEDAFARSTLWGFTVAAQTDDRVLVDMNAFLIRDATNITPRLSPGSYRLDDSRSAIYMPGTLVFPQNTEMEVSLTFAQQPGGGGGGRGGGGGGDFEGVSSVAASGEAATLRVHHSFMQLPDDDYEPRAFDPRSGFGAVTWADYAAPLGASMTQRFIRRHRLEKRDPGAAMSEAVEPIVYYLDPGAPEPVRTALLEGGNWWNRAFEAAGYRNAFRVVIRPDSIHSLDARYNVINWVHRSTRGWSTGASVTDPRTGEIIKGVVTLGSLRVRQDYLIFEGLLAPYVNGDERPPEIAQYALARIRQLSAHEIGHTLGFGHQYYDSRAGYISVLDYPHPLVTLRNDGSFDLSNVYENGIGEWDSVAVTWGYQDFAEGTDEQAALDRILDEAWERDLRYMSNQDTETHPGVDQWANGTDAAAELDRMMEVRRVALSRFGERTIRHGMPMATMEEALVPIYLHHRYQVDAAASTLGGLHYIYSIRGDGREPFRRASGDEQRTALRSLLATLRPSVLALPASVVNTIPPRPSGWGDHREMFPRYTGNVFDAISPAVVAADMVYAGLFDAERAARLVEQHALEPSLPGLEEIIDQSLAAAFDAPAASPYEEEIRRAVQRVAIDRLMNLAENARMPQVRAIATHRLEQSAQSAFTVAQDGNAQAGPHIALLTRDVRRFLDRPLSPYSPTVAPAAPPGAPIGEPAMNWIGSAGSFASSATGALTRAWRQRFDLEPWCTWPGS
ncbi:MAG: zinc-dependent metalloprotease [Longimicrobiales bacterium]